MRSLYFHVQLVVTGLSLCYLTFMPNWWSLGSLCAVPEIFHAFMSNWWSRGLSLYCPSVRKNFLGEGLTHLCGEGGRGGAIILLSRLDGFVARDFCYQIKMNFVEGDCGVPECGFCLATLDLDGVLFLPQPWAHSAPGNL